MHDGFLAGSGRPGASVLARPARAWRRRAAGAELGPDDLELVFAADPSLLDGRFANNAWLQELPDFMTKLTWDNAAAAEPGHRRGAAASSTATWSSWPAAAAPWPLPVYVLPGQAPLVGDPALGYGRDDAGRVGHGVGFDAYGLRTGGARDGGARPQR